MQSASAVDTAFPMNPVTASLRKGFGDVHAIAFLRPPPLDRLDQMLWKDTNDPAFP